MDHGEGGAVRDMTGGVMSDGENGGMEQMMESSGEMEIFRRDDGADGRLITGMTPRWRAERSGQGRRGDVGRV